jgi:hypothetical protein
VRKRDVLIQLWLERKEADRLAGLVARSGITRSAYLRQLIGGVVPADRPPPDYFAMMRELHSIGNNLNQIARRAHISGAADEERYARNVARLDEAIRRITEAVVLPRKA